MSAGSSSGAGRRAALVGCGLIGGSVGLGLRAAGWHVTGADADRSTAERALELGCVDAVGVDPAAELTFVCVPPDAIAGAVRAALATGPGLVTDVGSVKHGVVAAVDDPRFVGGHPMAGSELDGLDGADATMFAGATWVLTPTEATDPAAFALVRDAIVGLGAEVVAVSADRHDELVAMVSHVPHLTAGTLMNLADDAATEHATLLRLAAGGFRDMTRIASGQPGIWPDICTANAPAIVGVLDRLIERLGAVRDIVAEGRRDDLLAHLTQARRARANLPARMAGRPETLAEVRIPVPDRPGVLAEVTTLLGELGVNIVDLEIAHSTEGVRGTLLVLVDAGQADLVRGALFARGYRPTTTRLS